MSKVHVYTTGLVYCSVCAPKKMSFGAVEREVNIVNPTGISSQWRVSPEDFKDGGKNGKECENDSSRRHILMVC